MYILNRNSITDSLYNHILRILIKCIYLPSPILIPLSNLLYILVATYLNLLITIHYKGLKQYSILPETFIIISIPWYLTFLFLGNC